MITFDHIAISGETLTEAQAFVEESLGVALQPGGEHAVFHTHNALLGLENGLYLEAIAINPSAPAPDRPRWFDLDRFSGRPRLTNWICRTKSLKASLAEVPMDLGQPVALERGDLRWQMAVPGDGRLPYDNCAPALIQWETATHPAARLADRGVGLRRLTVQHPDVRSLKDALGPKLNDERIAFEIGTPGLHAEFTTPHGVRDIGT